MKLPPDKKKWPAALSGQKIGSNPAKMPDIRPKKASKRPALPMKKKSMLVTNILIKLLTCSDAM
jgi:hypothetical protein